MRLKILNRARGKFHSIEELFRCIMVEMPHNVEIRVETAPAIGASLRSVMTNILWAFRQKKQEVIHVTGDIHYAILGALYYPSVLTIHDLRFIDEHSGLKRFLLWLLWLYLPVKFATRVTVISEFTKQRLQSLVRVPLKKIQVIPDCVNPIFSADVKTTLCDPPKILHVGTTRNKNLERLISACSGLRVELCILGHLSPQQRAMLNSHRVIFREYFDLKVHQVADLYRQCDIVCFASLYEGFGIPILEAQAIGRPLITSNISPMKEVSGEGALLVDPCSEEAIRGAIGNLLSNAELRLDLVRKGFVNVQQYTATSVAKQYYELYRSLIPASI
jgi:glycosyltransferase involved in cell wall biosynthesis